jgi:hypothetical protein
MLQGQVDMQFSDLRTLLRLPQAGLESGCNFTAAAILFNLIAGSSVFFYDPSEDSLRDRQARGKRFKERCLRGFTLHKERGFLGIDSRRSSTNQHGILSHTPQDSMPNPRTPLK